METSPRTLGAYLRTARTARKLTLRDVEELAEVSNAYLSQVEGGRVVSPSPNVLFRLSKLYKIPYTELLRLAGYPVPTRSKPARATQFAARVGELSTAEEDALLEYLQFLRTKNPRGGDR